MATSNDKHLNPLSTAGILISLGIIYGDIGTSPIYTFRFIVGEHIITEELIFGGISCVFWTLTLITTVKYVYFALSADNRGEGGIFALYALVRRYKAKWVIYPAVIGWFLIGYWIATLRIKIKTLEEKLHDSEEKLDIIT